MKSEQLKFEENLTAAEQQVLIDEYMRRISRPDGWEHRYDYRGQSGTFAVYGSDQSGSYSTSQVPCLAILQGKFEDVLAVAVKLHLWTYWSKQCGGTIERVYVHDVNQVKAPN